MTDTRDESQSATPGGPAPTRIRDHDRSNSMPR